MLRPIHGPILCLLPCTPCAHQACSHAFHPLSSAMADLTGQAHEREITACCSFVVDRPYIITGGLPACLPRSCGTLVRTALPIPCQPHVPHPPHGGAAAEDGTISLWEQDLGRPLQALASPPQVYLEKGQGHGQMCRGVRALPLPRC